MILSFQTTVGKYVYGLAAIMIAMALGTLYVVSSSNRSYDEKQNIVKNYHLATIRHLGKVKEQVLLIVMRDMAHLHSTDARTIEERSAGAPESGSVLGPALYLLAKHLAAVRDIQKRYADRRFQSTATRMEAGAERYIGAVKAGATRTLVHIERDARTFLTVLSQYERLHAIALDESTERLRKDWKNLLYVLFLPLAALLLPGLAVVGWLFRLIDRALDRQGRAEAKVRELNLTLERRVEERTAELRQANEELLRKERLAALGQLTATVAHELRNPLGTIRTSFAVVNRQA